MLQEGKSTLEHKRTAPGKISVAVVTCSTSRFEKSRKGETPQDASGDVIVEELTLAGHAVAKRVLVSDDKKTVARTIVSTCRDVSVDAVIITGGTGIASRDITIEVAEGLFEKKIDGFGELFRYLSFKEIGSSAMISRSTAGIYSGKVIFCLPGSTDAVKLAMTRLIIPEIGHLVKHAKEK